MCHLCDARVRTRALATQMLRIPRSVPPPLKKVFDIRDVRYVMSTHSALCTRLSCEIPHCGGPFKVSEGLGFRTLCGGAVTTFGCHT